MLTFEIIYISKKYTLFILLYLLFSGTIFVSRGGTLFISTDTSANFIEVHVEETVARAKLKKVELVYEKFKIEVSGEISSAKIAPIMQILER